ncbi:MAG: cupin domain-containing protein [Actinomycetia bacterium]|nr:cupin domain-containing protein [Actinomycetes bacterium]
MVERAGVGAFDHMLHGGAAPTRVQWYFRESTQLPVAVQSWQLPPGGSEGMHTHREDAPLEELYVLVSGRAVMRVDDETYELAAGDAVLAPAGSDHDLRNAGENTAHVLVIWGNPGTALDWSRFVTGRMAHDAAQRD